MSCFILDYLFYNNEIIDYFLYDHSCDINEQSCINNDEEQPIKDYQYEVDTSHIDYEQYDINLVIKKKFEHKKTY